MSAPSPPLIASSPGVPTSVDVVTLLEQWVERGAAPAESVVQTLQSPVPPFGVQASRPLCRYPAYVRYVGTGNPRMSASYACTAVQ